MILLAGILGVGILAFTAVYALNAIFRERQVTAVVNTDGQQQIQEVLSSGRATQYHGPSLAARRSRVRSAVRPGVLLEILGGCTQLRLCSGGRASKMALYPHNRFLIVDASQLPAAEYSETDKPTAVVAFVVVQGDSDGDKRLTPSDLSSLVLAKPDGTQSKAVLENVRRVVSQEMIAEDVVILYEGASGDGKVVVSSTDFSRVADEPFELPKAAGS